jgi:hypothetical protein
MPSGMGLVAELNYGTSQYRVSRPTRGLLCSTAIAVSVRQKARIISPMLSNIVSILSGLGVGGLLGVFAKSALDKRQLKFTKVFDYKETRYKALTILMLTAVNPSKYELAQLKRHRPDMNGLDDLQRELELEYHNAMLFASDKVLKRFADFLQDKSMENYEAVARAMREDLYL